MPVPSTCPFCNALMPTTVASVAGPVNCPRCGEVVGTSGGARASRAAKRAAVESVASRRWSRQRLTVLIAMTVVLAIGGWALWAKWHHIRSPFGGATPPAKPVVVAPAEMAGLGYLPASTEAILAIQVPLLLERLGPEAQQDPSKALTALGLPESVAEIVDKASAVGLKNVDQLVIGLGFESRALPPELVIVVHARQPFDLDGIARHAKARALKKDGRTLYVAKAGPIPEVYWWKAADRVLVATILAKDLEGVPLSPRSGIDHLRPTVATLIRDRVADDSCAWLVAASDRWDKHLGPYTWLPGTPLQGRTDLLKPAERLRTVVMSIPFDADHSVDVQIGLKSSDTGDELRAIMADRFRGEAVDVSGDQETCRVQLKNDPASIRSVFGRLTTSGK